MNIEVLSQNIKTNCIKAGITIAQLEKELSFSAGSIGKWGQSAPSIEKVMAVAQYFEISIDELCGISKMKNGRVFMERLVEKTDIGDMVWVPCTLNELKSLRFDEMIYSNDCVEIYMVDYKGVKIFVALSGGKINLYISLGDNVCIRQHESKEQLYELWKLLGIKKQEQQDKIDFFKEQFANS